MDKRERKNIAIYVLLACIPIIILIFALAGGSGVNRVPGVTSAPGITPSGLPQLPTGQVLSGTLNPEQQTALERLTQESSEIPTVVAAEGTIRYLTANVTIPDSVASYPQAKADYFLKNYSDLFQFDLNSSLALSESSTGVTGTDFFRYKQVVQGIPVYGSDVIISVSSAGAVDSVNSGYINNINVSLTPQLSASDALAIAAQDLSAAVNSIISSTMTIYDPIVFGLPSADGSHLAWWLVIEDQTDGTPWSYIIDAHDGKILDKFVEIQDARNREVWDAHELGFIDPGLLPTLIMDENGAVDGQNPDADALAVWDHTGQVYDYYMSRFGRDSYDAHGAKIKNYIHAKIFCKNNAGWSPLYQAMIYCDNTTGLDVVSHELTHAVTSHEANLVYKNEHGALNESYSDVFAAMIDNGQPWLITSDDQGQTVIRNIAEPTDGYPRRMSEWVQPFDKRCTKLREMLSGCVHANSVIPSRAAYFLSEGGEQDNIHVRGIGKSKVEQIYYDTLTNRLGENSDFIQARQASVSACKSLIGGKYSITADDCVQVENAFAAVGIGTIPPTPNPTPTPPPSSGTGDATSTLLVVDVSGSMGNNWHGGVKIESAKSAANDIVNMIEQESQAGGVTHQIGLATFTTDATLALALTPDYNQVRQAIAGLVALNYTNIGAGLTIANQALLQANPGNDKFIILLSDGQSNTGLSYDEIIAGPVADASANGTCIYTVGFGDPGDIDENLLKRIANVSGCGEYYYAPNVNELEKIYIRIRHTSMGSILAEYTGTINQGQTLDVGQFSVPTGQSELALTLHWPGSALDMRLIDPRGQTIDKNYPSANITTYPNMIYALIEQPINGNWQLSIFGKDVPEGNTIFDAIASSRKGVVTPASTNFGPGILFALVVLIGGGLGAYTIVNRRSRSRRKTPIVRSIVGNASLSAIAGPLSGRIIDLPITGLSIGRSHDCNMQIQDFSVSRRHANLRFAEGQWFIQDQGSKGGTYVNGQKVSAVALKPGDCIKIGSSEFEIRY